MKKLILLLIPLSFAFASQVIAQVDEEDISTKKKDTILRIDERRFIYKGKIYKDNSPYFTLGYGLGRNLGKSSLEQNMTLSYHHFVKGVGLGVGFHTSSDDKIWWRSYQKMNDLHLMVGKRWDGVRYNLSAFAGPSYSYGSYVGYNDVREREWAYGYNTVGAVIELQFTYRIFYDVGVGITAYSAMNKHTKVVGTQFHLFFSTAYVRSYD